MFNTALIGGSFAGMTATLHHERGSGSVVVIDAGNPRNRKSPAAHAVTGWDGVAPKEILTWLQAEIAACPLVQFLESNVTRAQGRPDASEIKLEGNEKIEPRRIGLAQGVRAIRHHIQGLAEAWVRRVPHCPYCHSYELWGGAPAVLTTNLMSAHQDLMLRSDRSDSITLITGGMEGLDESALPAVDVRMEAGSLAATAADENRIDLTLTCGETERFNALFPRPRTTLTGSLAEQPGCAFADGPRGPFVGVGPMAQTSAPGVFAAGDAARPMPSVNFALADRAQARAAGHATLLFPDFITPLEIAA